MNFIGCFVFLHKHKDFTCSIQEISVGHCICLEDTVYIVWPLKILKLLLSKMWLCHQVVHVYNYDISKVPMGSAALIKQEVTGSLHFVQRNLNHLPLKFTAFQ